jgi:uncharacterized protein YodC (DUF2158 family)
MPTDCESFGLPILPPTENQVLFSGVWCGKLPPIGGLVSLKSGGPPMMVVDYAVEGLTVSWRDQGRVVESSFPAACLNLVSPL